MMRDALTPAEVAPLLWRAQAECEAEALQMVFGWAVEHFEEVTRGIVSLSMHLIDAWLGCSPMYSSGQ